MAEELPSLHVDTDWKKQAQEEKRKLAEKAAKEQEFKSAPPAVATSSPLSGAPADSRAGAAPKAARNARGTRGAREIPPASIATLASSLLTQTMYYLQELAYSGGDPATNLDMAKHNIDTLGVIEEKTASNLTEEERHALDVALHQARSQFVQVATQFI
jgi:hypothetical protein